MQYYNFTIEMAQGIIYAHMLENQLSFKIQPMKN
jgi:hypothetical protein